MTRDTVETLWNDLAEGVDGPIDGVLLALHGAMVAEHVQDADAEILSRMRGLVGPNVPIVVTFDLHANVADRVVHAGFPYADVYHAGPSVTVTGDGAGTRFQEIADTLMDEIWRTRDWTTVELLTADDAKTLAQKPDESGRPLVLADYSDNPGGGGYGDATNLLAAMIRNGLQNAAFAPIFDSAAVDACWAAGVDATVSLRIGGKFHPKSGAPLPVTGEVRFLGDGKYVCDGPMWKGLAMSMGRCAVLQVGGVEILLASQRFQITDLQNFLSVGIDPRKKSVVAVKSAQHFQAAYRPISRGVLFVNSGGLSNPDYNSFDYRKVRRPI